MGHWNSCELSEYHFGLNPCFLCLKEPSLLKHEKGEFTLDHHFTLNQVMGNMCLTQMILIYTDCDSSVHFGWKLLWIPCTEQEIFQILLFLQKSEKKIKWCKSV